MGSSGRSSSRPVNHHRPITRRPERAATSVTPGPLTPASRSADYHVVVQEPVVLVVADDHQALVKFLQMRQYTVVTAKTASEALDAIRQRRPAAVIVDLALRRGSGRDIVTSMPPNVPVLVLAGLRSETIHLESLRPHTRLVEKPYALLTLMDTLENMLEEASGEA